MKNQPLRCSMSAWKWDTDVFPDMVLSGPVDNCSLNWNLCRPFTPSLTSASGRSVDARHWVQQRHVLSAVEGQPLGAVVMHHLRDAGEHAAALVQGEAVLLGLGHHDVDAALAGPGSHTGGNRCKWRTGQRLLSYSYRSMLDKCDGICVFMICHCPGSDYSFRSRKSHVK